MRNMQGQLGNCSMIFFKNIKERHSTCNTWIASWRKIHCPITKWRFYLFAKVTMASLEVTIFFQLWKSIVSRRPSSEPPFCLFCPPPSLCGSAQSSPPLRANCSGLLARRRGLQTPPIGKAAWSQCQDSKQHNCYWPGNHPWKQCYCSVKTSTSHHLNYFLPRACH